MYLPVWRFQNSLRIQELSLSYYFCCVFLQEWKNFLKGDTTTLGISLIDIVALVIAHTK